MYKGSTDKIKCVCMWKGMVDGSGGGGGGGVAAPQTPLLDFFFFYPIPLPRGSTMATFRLGS